MAAIKRQAGQTDQQAHKKRKLQEASQQQDAKDKFLDGKSSREAHAQQKALTAQRKATKRNAEPIQRSKKIWERLRVKSQVPKPERKELVEELFGIITGHVHDFVFKHDSVRVIQCALKYATADQRKQIAEELRGSYRELAESKYAKFLIAKLVIMGDEMRDMIVPEFYGHVKRLIRHPEAGWIVDDIYRGAATPQQKAILLREWYGPEFVVFAGNSKASTDVSSNLADILEQHPEKRGPIMSHLKEMTNQLVQKKTTGFTMLHDAMLQYFLNCKPGSPEHTEFLEMLRDDEEGDCVRNLAFTKSGSRIVCLALAYGSAKDRRTLVKFFKSHMKTLADDVHGCHVILAAYEVIDDTVMTSKQIIGELIGKPSEDEAAANSLLGQAVHLVGRVALLYPLSAAPPKWLLTGEETKIVNEVCTIREETSKKDPETRRIELATSLSQPLLDLIASQAEELAKSSFGCQFATEVLLHANGEKQLALQAVAGMANADSDLLRTPHFGRMLKTLVQGGQFSKDTGSIVLIQPPLKFDAVLYEFITTDAKQSIVQWASGPNSFVILAMLEAPDFEHHGVLVKHLQENVAKLDTSNAGAKRIIEHLQVQTPQTRMVENQHIEKPKKKLRKSKDAT